MSWKPKYQSPSYMLKDTFDETAKRHKSIQDSDKDHIESNCKDVINITVKYDKYKPKLIETLEQHQNMWDGHLGTIRATIHYI